MLAEREPRVVPQLERAQPQLLEARHCAPRDRLVGEVGERRAPPEGDRRLEIVGGVGGALLAERLLGARDEPLEARQVELVRVEADPVAVAEGLDAVGADRAAQAVDVDLQRGPRGVGRLLAPDRVDETLPRDDAAAVEKELGEDGALLRAAERQRHAVRDRLHRPEDAKLDLDPLKSVSSGS